MSIESRDEIEALKHEVNRLFDANVKLNETTAMVTSELDREQKVGLALLAPLVSISQLSLIQKNEVLSTSQNLLQTQLSTAR